MPLGQAAADLRYLLARGYPRELVLKLVGDRYGLDARPRELLRRSVFAPLEAEARKQRLLAPGQLAGERLAIDGHNQIIILESALKGRALVLGDDGFIRDISRLGRHHRMDQVTKQAMAMMIRTCAELGVAGVEILLDAPISQSGRLAAGLEDLMKSHKLQGSARAVADPDRELKQSPALVASADSAIIDQCGRAFDLAGHIITNTLAIIAKTP